MKIPIQKDCNFLQKKEPERYSKTKNMKKKNNKIK